MSRKSILENIRKNKPNTLALNDFQFQSDVVDLYDAFCSAVVGVGGEIVEKDNFNIKDTFADAEHIGSKITTYPSTVDLDSASLQTLQKLDVAILKGEFGVAENGAVWLPEINMGQRMVPFIAEHLCIQLKRSDIVPDMHRAYKKLDTLPDYGVFISGPSKTADIEQTLVLGAQGPLSLKIIITD